MKKEVISFGVLFLILMFFPWWVTCLSALASLSVSRGYGALVVIIFLDVLYIPASFPYASGVFLILILGAYLFKKKLLINSMNEI